MKLYDYEPAPNPRRVRMFAAEKGISLDIVPVNLAEREQLSDEFRRINPRCTIPVLQTDEGACICDTKAICYYLDALHPEPALLGESPLQRAMVLMWTDICENEGFAAVAEGYRNHSRFFAGRSVPGSRDYEQVPALAERGRTRTVDFFQQLDERLAGSPYVAGDFFSFADISAYIFVDFAKRIKVAISDEQSNLASWYQRIDSRSSSSA